ncbi:malonyl-ACP O-methyltransferase BioC [Rheinheimera sp. 4Y26]|uniref:malonyl-ACP O-methyltransferase BioC n=1 Tax=Rheinheimera sp. 4Y26 TaxID=2977811 RepID=UPI0021B131F1|nr:malonyl-ACP O-methyltransferase BioC [Rheinheimera sp. 4Y26]MCT6700746.1 malonyl-ACP O-methyltransferase BioC [Rheinheimera sp. 4Y26]
MPRSIQTVATSDPQIRRHFDKAAQSYSQGASLQQQVATDLLALLATTRQLEPAQTRLLDLGCGPGWLHPELRKHCSELWAADLSEAMLAEAETLGLASRYIQADAAALPLPAQSVGCIFSSLMLQWCPKPEAVFAECYRLLEPGGQLVLSTLVTDSMAEFQQSWAQVDNKPHQLAFLPAEVLLNAVKAQGFSCQSQQLTYQLFYPDVLHLSRSFKQIGANFVAGRAGTGLGGKKRWAAFASAYEKFRTAQGLPLSYQVLQIVATKQADVLSIEPHCGF